MKPMLLEDHSPVDRDGEDELNDDEFEDISDDEDPNVMKIRDQLAPASARIYSTETLHSLIHDGLIDLNPPYQRGIVWPPNKQICLIDSIFRNFYVPPVVFAIQKDDDGENVRICVDGKQRLTSIQRFFDGQIPYRDPRTKKSFWYTTSETAKGSRLEVPDALKLEFCSKQMTCVEYSGIAPGMEREVFQRVQLGMTLTAAEKLQAISSPWAEWVSDLEVRYVSTEGGLGRMLAWDTKRSRDYQNLAHLVYCCEGLPSHNLPTAQKVEKWLSREDKPKALFKSHIEHALRDLCVIASDDALNQGFTKIRQRLAPVEFYFVGVLLFSLRDESLQTRAAGIYYLRSNIRSTFRDIRNNDKVGKTMWNLVDQICSNPNMALNLFYTVVNGTKDKKRKSRVDEDAEYERVGKVLNARSRK